MEPKILTDSVDDPQFWILSCDRISNDQRMLEAHLIGILAEKNHKPIPQTIDVRLRR